MSQRFLAIQRILGVIIVMSSMTKLPPALLAEAFADTFGIMLYQEDVIRAAMAVAGLPQPYEAGRSMAAVAAGSYNGESGVAVGISGVSEGGRWIYKVAGTTNSRGEGGVSVGAGIQW